MSTRALRPTDDRATAAAQSNPQAVSSQAGIPSAAQRSLSDAEEAGWRRMWDGWPICPACIAQTLSKPEHSAKNGVWPVPADYSLRIKADARCCKCNVRAAIAKAQGETA